MSNDGDASNRLSAALDQILSRSPDDPTAENAPTKPDVIPEAEPDEPYELPEIVLATEEEPTAASEPMLPARADTPASAPAPAPAPAAVPPAVAAAAAPPASVPPAATTSWSDHLTAVPADVRGAGLRAPGRKPRVRRVTRVLRHIDPWSTFKVALLFSLVTYLVGLTSGVLLWRVADRTGTLDNVERWFTQFGWETFEFQGEEIFRNAWVIGLFGVVAMTGGLVLLATVFNLVSDIIGGVRMTVLEEEVVERTVTSTRRYVVRQGPAAAGAAAVPVQRWDVDADADGDVDTTVDTSAGAGSPATEPRVHVAASPAGGRAVEPPAADWSVDD